MKILMLLKEVKWYKRNKWTLVNHLTKQIEKGKRRKIFNKVGTWIEYRIAKQHVGEGLSYVVTTNLKESEGIRKPTLQDWKQK